MAEMKTKANDKSVERFMNGIKDEKRRDDCLAVARLMEKITGQKPKMWGESIVGFGAYHYKYASGREGDWFLTGFSPRKQDLTLYITAGLERYADLLAGLGKFKTGKSCLYIKTIADIDLKVLADLIKISTVDIARRYAE